MTSSFALKSSLTAAMPPTVLLFHGAWGTAAQFTAAVSELNRPGLLPPGSAVAAIDLVLGRDGLGAGTPAASLASTRDAVVSKLSAEAEPAILVGHAMAGFLISAVAEAVPEKVRVRSRLARALCV